MGSDNRYTRRTFLEKATDVALPVLGFTVMGATAGPPAWDAWWSGNGREQTIENTRLLQEFIERRYGVIVDVEFSAEDLERIQEDPGFQVTMTEIPSEWVRFKALQKLRQILGKYPPELIRGNLRRVHLADTMRNPGSVNEFDVRGQAGQGETQGELIITISSPFSSHFAAFDMALSSYISDHEIAHIICKEIPETEWMALQPGAEYNWIAWRLEDPDNPPAGFASSYGTEGIEEDIATVASLVFGDQGILRDRIKNDRVLRAKVDYVKNWYEQKSGGRMGSRYWEDLRRSRVNERYWDEERTHS